MADNVAIWQSTVKAKWPIDSSVAGRSIGHMSEKSFGDRVIEEMKARGWSSAHLSRISGVSYDVINKFKQRPGSSTSAENAQKLSLALEIDSDEAPDTPEPSAYLPSDSRLIPVYDVAVSAGHGTFVEAENHVANMAFDPRYLSEVGASRELSIVRVKGDSMEPTLVDNDVVLVDHSKTSLDWDGLFVLRFGEAVHIKRIGRSGKRGHVMVLSDNRDLYPPVEAAIEDVEAVGKVLWYGRKV